MFIVEEYAEGCTNPDRQDSARMAILETRVGNAPMCMVKTGDLYSWVDEFGQDCGFQGQTILESWRKASVAFGSKIVLTKSASDILIKEWKAK